MTTTRSTKKKTDTPETKGEKPLKENADAVSKEEEKEEADRPSTIELKLRKKKPLPSLNYLLEHGARDPDAPPETFLESLVLPGLLLLTFVLSFAAWHFLFLKDSGPGQKKSWSEL